VKDINVGGEPDVFLNPGSKATSRLDCRKSPKPKTAIRDNAFGCHRDGLSKS